MLPTPIEFVDLTGDGKLDVLTASHNGRIHAFVGNGNGTFQPVIVTTTAHSEGRLAIADFDKDGKLDVIANASPGLYLHRGTGTGTFESATSFTSISGGTRAVDADGDGNMDVVAAGPFSFYAVRGNGDGTFQSPRRYAFGLGRDVSIADVDLDGRLDAIVIQGHASGDTHTLDVMLGLGDGSFAAPAVSRHDVLPLAFVTAGLADFDNNGTLDFLTRDFASSQQTVLLASASGTLTPAPSIAHFGTEAVLGDFDNDGNVDVVFARSDKIEWLRGLGDGRLEPAVESTIGAFVWGNRGTSADVNADGRLDAVFPIQNSRLGVALGNGDGTFAPATLLTLASQPNTVFARDFDADGDVDLLVPLEASINVLVNGGGGTFSAPVNYAFFGGPRGVAVADFDGDSILDLASGDAVRKELHLFVGSANATFEPEVRITVPTWTGSVVAADLDADGNSDVITDSGLFLQGRGDGTFRALYYQSLGRTAGVADLNGDGKLDIASFPSDSSKAGLARHYNNGCL